MTKQVTDMIAHVRAIRAELDAIHAELEAMAAEAVAPVPKAEGPQFIKSARRYLLSHGIDPDKEARG